MVHAHCMGTTGAELPAGVESIPSCACRPAQLEWFACKAMNAGREAAQMQLTQLAGKLLEVLPYTLTLLRCTADCCRKQSMQNRPSMPEVHPFLANGLCT